MEPLDICGFGEIRFLESKALALQLETREMTEKEFDTIIAKYPELIEEGLVFRGRQVNVGGKYVDLLFEDRHKQKLIVELKVGTIVRKHIAQLIDYEGYFLTPDDPTIRVMLVGNHVPNNLRLSLDHHGFEWKDIPVNKLINFLKEKNDKETLKYFSREELESKNITVRNEVTTKPVSTTKKESTGIKQEWYRFFEQLLELSNMKTPLFRNISPTDAQNWISAGAGKTARTWVYKIRKADAMVELYSRARNPEICKKRLEALQTKRREIEAAFGEELDWHYKEGSPQYNIRSWIIIGGLKDEEKWPEIQNDMVNRMIRLEKALRNHISVLD